MYSSTKWYHNGSFRKWHEMVLVSSGDFEVTVREFLFSILIVGVMAFIGFLIGSAIDAEANSAVLKFRQAPSIVVPDEFEHAMQTDVGSAFVNGTLEVDHGPVVVKEFFPGREFLAVRIVHQEYTMHEETFTTTDDDGETTTHTRTYWSWDDAGYEFLTAKKVRFCGRQFPFSKFSYRLVHGDRSIHSTGYNKRDVVTTYPKSFNATIFADLRRGTIMGMEIELNPNHLCEALRKEMCADAKFPGVVFLICWTMLTVIAVIAFFALENRWLEGS